MGVELAVAMWAAGAVSGWVLHGYRTELQQLRDKPKTLKQLMREQNVKPVRSVDDLAVPEHARLDDDEWEAWIAAMGEVRGHG